MAQFCGEGHEEKHVKMKPSVTIYMMNKSQAKFVEKAQFAPKKELVHVKKTSFVLFPLF